MIECAQSGRALLCAEVDPAAMLHRAPSLDATEWARYSVYRTVGTCDKEISLSTTTIRRSEKTRATMRDLARDVGVPMAEVVEQAIQLYRRQWFIAHANAGYAALLDDPEAWAEVEAERQA